MTATFHTVDVQDLHADDRYQRFTRKAMVKKLVEEWDEDLAQTLVLNDRGDGLLAIIDGNHRVTAKLQRLEAGLDDSPIMTAQIHQGLSLKQESDVFTKLNAQRVNATPVDKFNAAVISGEPLACMVSKALSANGMHVGYQTGINTITTVGGLTQVVKSCGANDSEAVDILTDVLSICHEWYHRSGKAAYRREIVEGLGMFLDRAWTVFPRDQVLARASKVLLAQDPYDVYTKARSRAVGNNRPSGHVAQVMAELYNHKMKRNVLPQWHEMDRRSKRRV